MVFQVLRNAFESAPPRPAVISARFREVLNKGKFTGWSTYPVEIELGDGKIRKDFFGFSVAGRSGPLLNEGITPEWE